MNTTDCKHEYEPFGADTYSGLFVYACRKCRDWKFRGELDGSLSFPDGRPERVSVVITDINRPSPFVRDNAAAYARAMAGGPQVATEIKSLGEVIARLARMMGQEGSR
jgi:hypothetical protein